MFRRKVQPLDDLLNQFLRQEGLESPLLQKRIIAAWDTVTGETITRYTQEKFIKNQTLFVKIINPALRSNLCMMQSDLVKKLNAAVGSMVITEIKIY
ncbi:DUF721 domain-containing protein [Prevotella scopos JCM 17725]|jgi:hypothetical protein|uniref:RNA-binding protein n=1 Tax=Prevotella scopos JCM 17725 TaxID=1236518 RepID=A0AAX2F4D3_9BACT|nr:DUF721 domain-containing protein [Prevotella scopos]ANR74056.1 hypothetical protein AXF22_11595 [Prevotella scopos JCM 17725]QUB44648.1 DUF721 domain-containing protein [Prevotella scopos JCM 17725]SHF91030.1 Protein of unknown function [Prevotella scopos JCM 17725]